MAMYKDFFRPITNTEALAYLERLGMQKPAAADEAALDKLIYAHQCSIPFENINPLNSLSVSLKTDDLVKKIITEKRGGFCFELNTLFCRLLEYCGYEVHGCRAGMLWDSGPRALAHHRGNIVRIGEDNYYCDVGCGGPQPAAAIKIENGSAKTAAGETFSVSRKDEYWWILRRAGCHGPENILEFTLVPEFEANFITPCYYCAASPDSKFTRKLRLGLRTENGSISVSGNTFIKTENGIRTERIINTKEELCRITKNEFGLSLCFKRTDFHR